MDMSDLITSLDLEYEEEFDALEDIEMLKHHLATYGSFKIENYY